MLAVALCTCTLYFLLSGKWPLAFVFAALTIAAKMNFLLILGFIFVYLFLTRERWWPFLYKSVGGFLILLLVLVALYYPYYTSPDTFGAPLKFLFGQNPAKSVAEVIGDVAYFAPSILSGNNDELKQNMAMPSGLSDGQLATWLAVKKVCQIFAFLLCAMMILRFWFFSPRDSKGWMNIFLRMLLVFLLFYSHVFYAWYLMILLPFVWYEGDRRFMQWLFVLTCFSNVHDILCAVNHYTTVYFVVLPLTFLSVAVFFWRLRNNFFTSLTPVGSSKS
jgi:hypothetical protein